MSKENNILKWSFSNQLFSLTFESQTFIQNVQTRAASSLRGDRRGQLRPRSRGGVPAHCARRLHRRLPTARSLHALRLVQWSLRFQLGLPWRWHLLPESQLRQLLRRSYHRVKGLRHLQSSGWSFAWKKILSDNKLLVWFLNCCWFMLLWWFMSHSFFLWFRGKEKAGCFCIFLWLLKRRAALQTGF